MSQKQPSLLERMRQGEKLTAAQQLELVVTLSIPAIMAQITSIVMQYIDASLVGSLGAHRRPSDWGPAVPGCLVELQGRWHLDFQYRPPIRLELEERTRPEAL